jgi:hypothetical protein
MKLYEIKRKNNDLSCYWIVMAESLTQAINKLIDRRSIDPDEQIENFSFFELKEGLVTFECEF